MHSQFSIPRSRAVRIHKIWWIDGHGHWRIADEGTAVSVGCESELTGDVLAQQQKIGGVRAVADRQGAAGVTGGLRKTQGRVRPKRNVRQIKEVPKMEARDRAAEVHRRIKLEFS